MPYRVTAFLLIILGLAITIFFLFQLSSDFTIWSWNPNTEVTGQVGEYIGGFVGTVFSLAGFIILILTLNQQIKSFSIERFENNFFELVKFHRENVNELEFKRCGSKKDEQVFKSKQVFKVIYEQIIDVINEIDIFFKDDSGKILTANYIYESSFLNSISSNPIMKERKIHAEEIAKLNIAYLIVFFGLSKEGFETIKSFLNDKFKKDFYEPILDYIKLKPIGESKNWNTWIQINSLSKKGKLKISKEFKILRLKGIYIHEKLNVDGQKIKFYRSNYFKYYGGHQFRLSQYFRHLFQTVKYANTRSFLKFNEKYQYIKILRSQLSPYEQLVFFFNSISLLGNTWEYNYEKPNLKIDYNQQLITKYNLTKNIYGDKINNIAFRHYYPTVQYEFGEKKENCIRKDYK